VLSFDAMVPNGVDSSELGQWKKYGAVNWVGGKSMARTALDWVGCNLGFGRRGESWPAMARGGGLVYFLKNEGRMGVEK
jgi:hypothetical protein